MTTQDQPLPPWLPSARWQRALLPGEVRGDSLGGRSPRDWFIDVVCFLLAIGISAAVLSDTWEEHSVPMRWVEVATAVAACVALWWRRSHPLAIALATAIPSLVLGGPAGAGVIALFGAVIRVPGRWVLALTAIGIAAAFTYPAVYPGSDDYLTEASFGVLFTLIVVGWGLFVRVQRQLVHSLRERFTRLEEEQRLRVEQARDAERRRIAREMHDVLAHRVALLSLHAGALEFRPDAPPEEIAEAAGVVRASARAALVDLREVIGVLRERDPEADLSDDDPEPPQPTLVQIPALVERSRAAGLKVACRIELGEAQVGEALGRTAYRIVQEGLTNAHKHAPASAAEVAVAVARGELVVEVRSRRPVGALAAAALPGAGTGLIGLAERVEIAGGSFRHGPDEAGDFLLRAELPLEGAAR
ncbi:histidine kinase [Conexibacter sp. JD483]|uniref:sensor histidine kinase n=1 Tax=unclassified Conexibacter TaxID=2627773 RepID=UPI00271FFA45|nr:MULTISPECIES: histidine kinase [unclassified Conexibacter]MDO8185254.1 histidine kinase [Conexibacter sp. CPCC 205706]MDO8198300.1 histidine kinase [Conexibacter sp. CPCC 205762]MDR9367739.1 histidine kinase [Conexibacter sp. JD483]